MSVSGVSSSAPAPASASSYLTSPAVELAQFQGTTLDTLFNGVSGEPSDLVSLTSTAVASSLYQRPGLLAGLTQWDGSMTPGSQRVAAPAPPATSPAPAPMFSFNPFDQASWWADPKGSTVDLTA